MLVLTKCKLYLMMAHMLFEISCKNEPYTVTEGIIDRAGVIDIHIRMLTILFKLIWVSIIPALSIIPSVAVYSL